MFAGKTTALISEYFSILMDGISGDSVFMKPSIDNRYAGDAVVTHDGESVACVNVCCSDDIRRFAENKQNIFIDEIQFLDISEYEDVLMELIFAGKNLFLAGLDMDANGLPFSTTAFCLALATSVVKLKALCYCGNPATMTRKKGTWPERVRLGSANDYEAVCRTCFLKYKNQQYNG